MGAAPGSESSFDINSAHRSEIKQQLIGIAAFERVPLPRRQSG
jgi:hypothetical protein